MARPFLAKEYSILLGYLEARQPICLFFHMLDS